MRDPIEDGAGGDEGDNVRRELGDVLDRRPLPASGRLRLLDPRLDSVGELFDGAPHEHPAWLRIGESPVLSGRLEDVVVPGPPELEHEVLELLVLLLEV